MTPTDADTQTQELIDKIAGAKCDKGEAVYSYGGLVGYSHSDCCNSVNGTGYHPLAQVLRVDCDYDGGNWPCTNPGAFPDKSKPVCLHTRPVTASEGRERFYDLLVAGDFAVLPSMEILDFDSDKKWYAHTRIDQPVSAGFGPDPFTALLRAIAVVVGVTAPEVGNAV